MKWGKKVGRNIVFLNIEIFGATRRKVAWPSGLRRWFKAPVFSKARVRIPPLPIIFAGIIKKSLFLL